jgi:hypothetical protein
MTTDKIRIRKCPIKIGILDTHIARRLTAPLRRVVYQDSALETVHARGLCPTCVVRANQSPR